MKEDVKSGSNGQNEARPNSKINNQWYHYNPQSDVVLVFVHGFFSNSKDCWQSNEVYWPDMIMGDTRFANPSIFLAGYYTAHDSGDYKLAECSAELYSGISTMQIDGEAPPLEKSNIIFVCHSLGGIVTRYMLETRYEKFSKKSVGLVLMASPSMGSAYADSLLKVILFYKNGMANQLRAMNELLLDLDSRFKNMIESGRINKLVGIEAIEHHSLFRFPWLPQPFKPIVTKESAARYFGNPRIIPGTNHSTIVKPDSLHHPSHKFLVEFFAQNYSAHIKRNDACRVQHKSFPAQIEKNAEVNGEIWNQVLFDILNSDNIKYYLRRESDNELARHLGLYSLWICGPSACGKTSSARYLTISHGFKPIEICLSHYSDPLTTEQCIKEIIGTLEQMVNEQQGKPHNFQTLVAMLSAYATTSPLILYLDEVPVTDDPSSVIELIKFVADLLTSVKQRTGRSELRIVISSIRPPAGSALKSSAKIGELLKVYTLASWSDDELNDLLKTILPHLDDLNMSRKSIAELIVKCKGSPRILKNHIRDELLNIAPA